MFTGIIEDTGKIKNIIRRKDKYEFTIYNINLSLQLKIGDSISINGTCLTVTDRVMYEFKVDVVPETLNTTTIGSLKAGDFVNLERALRADSRFDGHIVTGHTDTKSTILDIQKNNEGVSIEIVKPDKFSRYIIDKGSISVDGISLTIAKVKSRTFIVAIIPHTYEKTILKSKKAGSLVNLEFDVMGKYVEKMLEGKYLKDWPAVSDEKIGWEFLKKSGFLN